MRFIPVTTIITVSHDSSEIILICWSAAQETLLLCCLIFLWKPWYIVLFFEYKTEMKPMKQIINVFTVMFDQFKESMLKKKY